MHKKVEANSLEYRTLIDTHSQYIKQYGFKYLNSIYCDNIINDLYNAIENTLNKLNDDKLLQTYKLWNEVNDKREDEMINNIYNYSKKNKFDNGLFFIGAAHRNSIISKIVKYIKSGSIEVTWNYSNYDKIFY